MVAVQLGMVTGCALVLRLHHVLWIDASGVADLPTALAAAAATA